MNENDPKVNSDKPKTRPKKDPLPNHQIIKYLSDLFDFRLNEVSGKIEILINGEWHEMLDAYFAKVMSAARMLRNHGDEMAKDHIIKQAIEDYSYDKKYNPIKLYLEDSRAYYKKNMNTMPSAVSQLLDAIETDDPVAMQCFISRWLLGCVGLVYHKFQNHCLVMVGPQGVGKTTFFRVLAKDFPKYYSEQLLIPTSTDSIIKLTNTFIWQIDEFGTMLKSYNRNHMKAFITTESTNVRAPYDKYAKERARLANLAGTTNDDTFLTDMTGNRRYLIVKINNINLDAIKKIDMRMLWGEIADTVFTYGVSACKLTDAEIKIQNHINSDSEITDPLEEYSKGWFVVTKKPTDFVKTKDITTKVQQTTNSNIYHIPQKMADIMKRLGATPTRTNKFRGYTGIKWVPLEDPNRTIATIKAGRYGKDE